MNADFTFPPRPKPVPRPQPVQQSPTEPVNRDSNALRASVLDVALALGLGTNDGVAKWMFNNAVEEEEEDDEEDSSKAPLSATSDEYGNYSYSTPATSTSSHSETQPAPLQVRFPVQPVTLISTPAPFPEPPSGGNKLRKPRRPDGYESDGGYVSDGGKKGRVRTKSKTAKDAPPSMPISEPMELVKLSKEEKKRRKKEAKFSQDHGAETDVEDAVASKSKSKPPKAKKKEKKSSTDAGGGYETDDGYVSSKPKSGRSRFFSIRKKSADNATEAPAPEPVPELPKMPEFDLPIASRFATTFEGEAPSRSATPLLPPSRPFASSGTVNSGSSASSLSSSSNSLLTPGDRDSFGLRSPSGLHDAGDSTVHADQLNSRDPSSPSKTNSSPGGKSKFSFFPLSRTGSANSLDPSANASPKPGKHVPTPITTATLSAPNTALNSVAPSPSHLVGSPFVLLTPINTNTPPRAVSPSPSAATDMIIPSSDFIVPSRSASPLPSPSPSSQPGPAPNVLAYYNYDVPPPSPPPSGPLPRAPPSSSGRARDAMREPLVGVARLRGMSQDRGGGGRSVSPSPTAVVGMRPVSPLPGGAGDALSPVSPGGGGTMLRPLSPGGGTMLRPLSPGGLTSPVSPGVQRGRAAPFPMQPVSGTRPPAVGVGLAARVKVQRYADLYAIQLPPSRRARFADEEGADEVDIRVEDWDEDDGVRDAEEGEEMQQVLGRFRDANAQREEKGRRMAIALERNNSGALRPGTGRPIRSSSPTPQAAGDARYPDGGYSDDDQASQYPDEDRTAGRSTMYRVENGGSDTMRWSGYTDTRASFLDLDKSEKARGALVDRVGAMFDLSGRERPAVPPVPKLPAGLMAGGNRF
ncbi:hypothetical protein C8R45DRAFT_470424 [Mycena sanguinolenta]|nr:hypothetical protein C8R45DRAFT_470424 [Mycena sanguinolenta]